MSSLEFAQIETSLGQRERLSTAKRARWRDVLTATLVLGPLAVKFLFPRWLEDTYSFQLFGAPVLVVELAWVALLLFHRRISTPALAWWGALGLGWVLCSTVVAARVPAVAVWAGIDAYLPLLVAGVLPFGERHRSALRWLVGGVLFAIVAELALFSAGLIGYDVSLADHSYAGFQRIMTTVGSPIATGTVILILAVWGADLWSTNQAMTIAIAVVGVFGVALTFSRGPILMALCYLWARAFVPILRARSLRDAIIRATGVILLTILAGYVVAQLFVELGLWSALEARWYEQTADAGRIGRYLDGWNAFLRDPVFGLGAGHYYARLRLWGGTFVPLGATSPHNMYVLTLAETGLFGFAIYAGGALALSIGAIGSWRARPAALLIPIVCLVGMNVELIYCEADLALLFAAFAAWTLRSPRFDSACRRSVVA